MSASPRVYVYNSSLACTDFRSGKDLFETKLADGLVGRLPRLALDVHRAGAPLVRGHAQGGGIRERLAPHVRSVSDGAHVGDAVVAVFAGRLLGRQDVAGLCSGLSSGRLGHGQHVEER